MRARLSALALLSSALAAIAIVAVLGEPPSSAAPGGAATVGPRVPAVAASSWPEAWPEGLGAAPNATTVEGSSAAGNAGRRWFVAGSDATTVRLRIPEPLDRSSAGGVLAVGDSVLDGIAPLLDRELTGWRLEVDAREGRGVPEGLDRLEVHDTARVVVIVLGHNYETEGLAFDWFRAVPRLLPRAERIVLVTVAEWSPSQTEVNQAIWLAAAEDPRVVVADWSSVSKAAPELLRSDRVHLTPEGNEALASLVAAFVGSAAG
jgi:hypothetical protein